MNHKFIMRLAGFGFYSALIKLVWGFVFLAPGNTFSTIKSYSTMAIYGTEEQWSIAFIMIGFIHLLSIFSTSLHMRIIMQIVSVGLWIFIAAMFGLSNPIGTGVWTYAAAAICDFIAIVYLLRFEQGGYK